MKKRLLSLLLAGCIFLTSVVPVLADQTDSTGVPERSIEFQDAEVVVEEPVDQDADAVVEEPVDQDADAVIDESVDQGAEVVVEESATQDADALIEEDKVENTIAEKTIVEDTAVVENITAETASTEPYVIDYESHVANIGWMDPVSSETYGVYSGTVGRNLWMESLKINPKGLTGITYSAHVANIGWMDYVSADNSAAFAGTTGRALAMEAVRIKLEGENAEKYDIYYRAHVTNFGWLGWVKNGESAGSAGYAYTLQALEIKVLPKGQVPEGYNPAQRGYEEKFRMHQKACVQGRGWTALGEVGAVLGTTGQNRYLEGIQFQTNHAFGIGVAYSTHVSNIGWMEEVQNGAVSGAPGRGLPIEAVKIRLTGENAGKYDIYYQAHVTNMGWLDWAKNGEAAGSSGLAYSLQAVRVAIVAKGGAAPGNTGFAYATNAGVSAQGYSKTKGWLPNVGSGAVIGTTGQSLPLQGVKISLLGAQNTGIKYSTHVSNVGWQSYVSDGAEAGLPARNEQIEAIKIELTGAGSRYYDIWYRVHSANVGWLDWACNGAQAGTTSMNYAAEAIQIILLPKGSAAPGSTRRPFTDTPEGWVYIDGFRRYRDMWGNVLDDVSHLFNPSQKRITVDCKRGITTVYGYNSATGKYDTPIKAFWCSVGAYGSKTPSGTYKIYRKYTQKVMVASDGSYRVWAPYISCFNGSIYFHGVASINDSSNLIKRSNFEALGTPKSAGCVRLAAIDAKWIYENCGIGTIVFVSGYSQNIDCPIPSPIRYKWVGGSVAPDPSL